MNLLLSEADIRSVCRDLLSRPTPSSGRSLRRELQARYQAAGNTARVFAIWREEQCAHAEAVSQSRRAGPELPLEVAILQRRLVMAEAQTLQFQARAERAEYREQAHQDHWALEVDKLREAIRAQPNHSAEIRRLQTQVMELTVELGQVRGQVNLPADRDEH